MAGINFHKRFSVGLALDSTPDEYEKLFSLYGDKIDNIYFSPPLGDRFHGRNKIADQFHSPEIQERFWEILKVAASHDITLEVVLNTHLLEPGDIELTAEAFAKRGVALGKICVQDSYYDEARTVFSGCEFVHSVNCMPDDRDKILETAPLYDEYVVGRQYIRDEKLFAEIKQKGPRVVLLMNNGCSHWCGGCGELSHCGEAHQKTLQRFTSQQIYAIQSIMPYEIHEEFFKTSDVDLFKLSTRNADVRYITLLLDSYINNNASEYIKESKDFYLLWSRLLWMKKDFQDYDYEMIREEKKKVCKDRSLYYREPPV